MRAAGRDEMGCMCVCTPSLKLEVCSLTASWFQVQNVVHFLVLKELLYIPTDAFSSEKQYIV